ncbi:pyruvate dehydrogenase (acetyl-transferring) E1 component subunit alpha [Vulgatibacter incomptus]|uniref:Pyruvate dehydrogenase E1 component subunit alpha n=1 Tax=Vulgatibacter incomptus TaxID=1391653 RepID=A0A0K1PCE7_9BACT|nr:pyruvate dehydrogenase (acetyl-transferring) E1 component subunit alpha [Vulgatibacter incomptus]AKU91195.1 Pyruvate dehydrogenase E1 component alpha subunit [Vulgatibacter incomptus]
MAKPTYGLAEKLDKATLVNMYRQLVLLRKFEERCAQQYALQKIAGFCHLYIGQEAVAVGTEFGITPDDYVITAYRDHGQILTRGTPPGPVMAELFGKVTGVAKGKGGSMHLFDIPRNFYGGWGIVGGQIPLALGAAYSSKYREDGKVTVCYFGEAAVNQGAFHEALNMAALWKVPAIFICENNRYGMGTPIEVSSAVTQVHKRACAYDMPGVYADGKDTLAMYEAVKAAADRARAGEGPTLIEADTYRYRGHSMSDPAVYRTREEVDQERKLDPIPKMRDWILSKKAAKEAELDAIDEQIDKDVEESIRFAEESPWPPVSDLYEDIYVDPIRQHGDMK